MDINSVLTSVVIAGLCTGAFSLIASIIKTNKESRLSRITDFRADWRGELRSIAEKISAINIDIMTDKDEVRLTKTLTSLMVRINPKGQFENDNILFDSHIWESILILSDTKKRNNLEKKRLINYLSCLLKHDWERSKLEASVNIQQIIGYGIYFVSNAFLVYISYKEFTGTTWIDVFLLITIFMMLFFSPNLMLAFYRLINKKSDWADTVFSYVLIAGLLIAFLVTINKQDNGIHTLIVPVILQLIALMFILISKNKTHKNDKDYIKEVMLIKKHYH